MLSLLGKGSFLEIDFVSVPDYDTALLRAGEEKESAASTIVVVSYQDATFYMEGILCRRRFAYCDVGVL